MMSVGQVPFLFSLVSSRWSAVLIFGVVLAGGCSRAAPAPSAPPGQTIADTAKLVEPAGKGPASKK